MPILRPLLVRWTRRLEFWTRVVNRLSSTVPQSHWGPWWVGTRPELNITAQNYFFDEVHFVVPDPYGRPCMGRAGLNHPYMIRKACDETGQMSQEMKLAPQISHSVKFLFFSPRVPAADLGVAYGQAIDSKTLQGCPLAVLDGIPRQNQPGRPISSAPKACTCLQSPHGRRWRAKHRI